MINQKQAIAVYNHFINDVLGHETWFQNTNPHVKASLLYGSVAKGTNRDNSDIDILLVVPLEVEQAYTTGEYFYTYQNHVINIVLRSIERLRIIAQEQTDMFQKEVFRGAITITDSDDEVKNLLSEISQI